MVRRQAEGRRRGAGARQRAAQRGPCALAPRSDASSTCEGRPVATTRWSRCLRRAEPCCLSFGHPAMYARQLDGRRTGAARNPSPCRNGPSPSPAGRIRSTTAAACAPDADQTAHKRLGKPGAGLASARALKAGWRGGQSVTVGLQLVLPACEIASGALPLPSQPHQLWASSPAAPCRLIAPLGTSGIAVGFISSPPAPLQAECRSCSSRRGPLRLPAALAKRQVRGDPTPGGAWMPRQLFGPG